MFLKEGQPDESYQTADKLQPSPAEYTLLAKLVREQIEKDENSLKDSAR